jgi:hypothetical protein
MGSGRSVFGKAKDARANRVCGTHLQFAADPAVGNAVVPQTRRDSDLPGNVGRGLRCVVIRFAGCSHETAQSSPPVLFFDLLQFSGLESWGQGKVPIISSEVASPCLGSDRPTRRKLAELLDFLFRGVGGQARQVLGVLVPSSGGIRKTHLGEQRLSRKPRRTRLKPQFSQTAPTKGCTSSGFDDVSANGIQVNVVDDPDQSGRIFHEQSLVTPLKEMPPLAPKAVETSGESTLQPVHPVDQIRLRGFEGEVKVIAHDSIRMHAPTVAQTRLGQRLFEGMGGAGSFKDITAVVAPVDHVVKRPFILNSQHPRHGLTPPSTAPPSQHWLYPIYGVSLQNA